MKRGEETIIPNWVLQAARELTLAADLKVLMFLAEHWRYREAAFGPGRISDELGIDYRTVTKSLARLAEKGHIVSADGAHCLRGACATLAQRLHKNTSKKTPTKTDVKTVQHDKKPALKKEKKGNKEKENNTPPPPSVVITIPEVLTNLPGFTEKWAKWIAVRRQKKYRALVPGELEALYVFLLDQPDPLACIDNATRGGWKTLYPIKTFTPAARTPRPLPSRANLDDADYWAQAAREEEERFQAMGWN